MRLGWLKESYSEIMKKCLQSNEERCKARKRFEDTPITARKALFENFEKWLSLYTVANMYMIDAIERFSPQTAKLLRRQVTGFSKRQKELINGKYWNDPEFKGLVLSEEQRDEHINDLLHHAVKAGDLHEKEVNLAFIVAMDTLERVRGEFPLKPEERILQTLESHDSKLGKMYLGAYAALDSDNPERFRYCSVSMREIIDGTIGKTAEERRKKIQSTTHSKQEAEILESLYNLIRSVDLACNKGVHDDIQADTAFLAVEATELMINYIYRINPRSQ